MKIINENHSVFQDFTSQRQKLELKTKKNNKNRNFKKVVAAAALLGGVLPVCALNLKRGKGDVFVNTLKDKAAPLKDKGKSFLDIFEIDGLKGILASTAGAIAAGTASGLVADKNPVNRKEKGKEGIFEFLNNMTPTLLVAGGECLTKKAGINSAPVKAAVIAGSVAGGMFIANKASNKINEKVFNTDKKDKRGFKLTDCLVHIDDIIGLLVIAEVPLAKKIHVDKFLPLLYARTGYEAGCAQKKS